MPEVGNKIEDEEKSAVDIATAANVAIEIAMIAVDFIPGGKAVKLVSGVKKYAPVAKRMVGKLPDVAPIAKQAADALQDKAPDAIAVGADKVKGAMKSAADAAADRGRAVGDSVKESVEAREREKARKAARRALLDGAGNQMPVVQFLQNWEIQNGAAVQPGDGYMGFSGCYVIATYAHPVKKGDFSKFRDLYVGKSENVGDSIFKDLTGRGNVDVYADVKYKQCVYILVYPCLPEKIDELEASLVTALDADRSYNRGASAAIA